MPESEPKPKLVELVAPGAGQGYKATLRNGKAAVVHEISAPAPEVAAAIPRIQRLAENRHPALAPVLAWGTDPNGIWVAVEPNEGTPLGQILSRGPLTPPAAAALGAALLSGVAALHEAGVAMGGFGAAVVRVTGNGEVRLSGHPAAAVRGAPSQSDLRADVRSCGMAICAAFGVDPAGAPAPQNVPPGLVVTMRSMASGAMGAAADRAQGALREMASALLAPDRMTASQAELATRAGGREMPSITPFLPKEEEMRQAPPAPAPAPPPAPAVTAPPLPVWTPPPPEDAPRKTISYEPPPRAVETYSNLPAQFQQPAPPAPAPAPPPPAFPSAPSIPTWDAPVEAAPTPPAAPAEPAAPSPPAAAEPPAAPLAPQAPAPPPIPTWEPIAAPAETQAPAPAPWEPPAPAPAPAPYEPPAPGPAPYEPPARPVPAEIPAATAAPAPDTTRPSWTSIPTPSWSPSGEPAEADAPVAAAAPATAAGATAITQAPRPSSPAIPSAPARKPPTTRRPSSDQPSERPSWLIPVIAAAAILLIVLVGGGIYLASRGGSPGVATNSPSPKTSPGTSPSASPSGGPQAVPTYAPAAVPPVKSVTFCTTGKCADATANTSCKLGSNCRVTVEMKFSTAQHAEVAYIVKFFDRCTGTTTDLPGRSFTPPPPGYTTVDISANLTFPAGAKSAAIVAVTTSPASAASAPILLGANAC